MMIRWSWWCLVSSITRQLSMSCSISYPVKCIFVLAMQFVMFVGVRDTREARCSVWSSRFKMTTRRASCCRYKGVTASLVPCCWFLGRLFSPVECRRSFLCLIGHVRHAVPVSLICRGPKVTLLRQLYVTFATGLPVFPSTTLPASWHLRRTEQREDYVEQVCTL